MSLRDTDTATDFYGAVTTFAAQDLSVVGSKITLTFDFYNDTRWPSGRQLSAGLYNSNGSVVTGDTTAAGLGWGATANDSGMLATAQRYSDRFELRESVGQGLGENLTRLQDRTNNSAYGEDGLWFDYTLEIENIGGDLQTTATWSGSDIAGQESVSQTWLTDAGDVNNYTFDEIGFTARANVNTSFDNVEVTYVVPEPSSAALLGLGGLALVLRRRK
ncbi:PEP-CTERM sorting domain-containing protein [Verrucomicrobiaceae bacterium R5-34]|nr:PEP-CTERM sorting domain-containing protein [Verrucomicrobiaceae bacterium R5-34]